MIDGKITTIIEILRQKANKQTNKQRSKQTQKTKQKTNKPKPHNNTIGIMIYFT